MKRLIPALLLTASLGGCGTVLNMGVGTCPPYSYPHIYGGVEFDGTDLLGSRSCPQKVCGFLDLPFSLVADTLTLPWTISEAIRHPAPQNRGVEEP